MGGTSGKLRQQNQCIADLKEMNKKRTPALNTRRSQLIAQEDLTLMNRTDLLILLKLDLLEMQRQDILRYTKEELSQIMHCDGVDMAREELLRLVRKDVFEMGREGLQIEGLNTRSSDSTASADETHQGRQGMDVDDDEPTTESDETRPGSIPPGGNANKEMCNIAAPTHIIKVEPSLDDTDEVNQLTGAIDYKKIITNNGGLDNIKPEVYTYNTNMKAEVSEVKASEDQHVDYGIVSESQLVSPGADRIEFEGAYGNDDDESKAATCTTDKVVKDQGTIGKSKIK